ncbi:MAG: DUF922 domain-containing protein [Rhizobiaceae bacterium]|nr:DUF922 domain-containing protein [Rhizobiaceae bacterium]
MNQVLKKTSIVLALGFLSACTAFGERTLVSVGYYTVSGDTFSELDQEIKLHGPNVLGVGDALASTDLKMVPDIRYSRTSNGCEITNARIRVNARVTLPRHSNERRLKAELANAWTNLSEYARVHEAVHLVIADRYALKIEDAVKELDNRESCDQLRADVESEFSRLFEEHHKEQLAFDASEKIRIRKLLAENRRERAS